MLFNSIQFLIFFPVVTFLYFSLPHKYRWFMLLMASCYFYMSFIPVYILILFFTTTIDYIAAILIEDASGRKRKLYITLSLISNIGVLAFFKYYNFFVENINYFFSLINIEHSASYLSIILPIGLSFHTFQAMSYTIEVYKGNQKAERHYGIFALYVMFYPQLVAGPIERPQNLIAQFYEKHYFDYDRVIDGLKLMLWGLFKKTVIADRLTLFVDQVYSNPQNYEGISLIIATIFFAFQIYCDFSGYSDIAIGSAQVMGFKLMTNFNRPYFSKSISEFWKRWHISLSTWFKDYLYISLGGSRVGKYRLYFNLFVTFLVSGFWHGANWTYIIWGGLNGFYLIFSILTSDIRKKIAHLTGISNYPRIHNYYQILITFSLTCFAWVFFRAESITDAVYIITHMFTGLEKIPLYLSDVDYFKQYLALGQRKWEFLLAVLSIVALETVHLIQRKNRLREFIKSKPVYIRWSIYYGTIMVILIFGVFSNQKFIYFQF